MKNKKILAIILAIVFAVAVGVVIYSTQASKNDKQPETEVSQSVTKDTTVPATAPLQKEDEVVTITEESTKKTSAEVPKAVQGKYWYLYDDKKLTVYVFQFDKNNQVNLAYFGNETISGLDAEYTKGYSVYSYSNGKITIKDLPDQFPDSSFTFEVKDNKVMSGKTELEAMDDLSLDNALRHFV